MMNEDVTLVDWVIGELAEIPVDRDDAELAAIAIAVHLEDALELTMPPELLHAHHLASPAARERTVRLLHGGL